MCLWRLLAGADYNPAWDGPSGTGGGIGNSSGDGNRGVGGTGGGNGVQT